MNELIKTISLIVIAVTTWKIEKRLRPGDVEVISDLDIEEIKEVINSINSKESIKF